MSMLRATQQNTQALAEGDGKLRATHQNVQALGSGDGVLRVTHQYIEVLASETDPLEQSINHFLGLSSEEGTPGLRATQQNVQVLAEGGGGELRVTEQYLTVLASEGDPLTQSLDSELDLVSGTDLGLLEVVESELALDHTVSVGFILSRAASSTLAMSHLARPSIFVISASSSLSLTSDFEHQGPRRPKMKHAMTLTGQASVRVGINVESVVSELLLEQRARGGKDKFGITTSSIVFGQEAFNRYTGDHDLGLEHFVVVGKSKGAQSDLLLQDVLARRVFYARQFAHVIPVQQALTYILVRPCTSKLYAPAVGATSLVSATVPTLTHDTLTLTYPFVSPSQTVVLRNPRFDNLDRLGFTRINRETRGGSLIVFSDPQWPKTQTLVLTLTGLKADQVTALRTFLRASSGKEVGLLDWEGRQWRGLILTPNAMISQDERAAYSVILEFQGVQA